MRLHCTNGPRPVVCGCHEPGPLYMSMQKLRRHSRLWIATVVGVMVYLLLPGGVAPLIRLLVAWNAGVVLFLILLYALIFRLSADQIRAKYKDEDEIAPVILVLVTIASLMSVCGHHLAADR